MGRADPPARPEDRGPLRLPVEVLKGVGPVKGAALRAAGLHTLGDLLHHLPRDYQDRTHATPIAELEPGAHALVFGTVSGVRKGRGRRPKVVEVAVSDGTGTLLAAWFGAAPYVLAFFERGREVVLMGRTERRRVPVRGGPPGGVLRMAHPEFEDGSRPDDGLHRGVVVPVYTAPEGLGLRELRALIRQALVEHAASGTELVPEALRRDLSLPGRLDALRTLHFPDSPQDLPALRAGTHAAHEALLWEDLLLLQTALLRRRAALPAARPAAPSEPQPTGLAARAEAALPFALTDAQRRALGTLRAELRGRRPMQRLLQGDVGSGKTVVGLLAALSVLEAGGQAAVLAPTEVLAAQWQVRAEALLGPLGLPSLLLTGATSGVERERALRAIAEGEARFVVGTHAVLQRSVRFADLRLAIVDEQQRFGVFQRAELLHKGRRPHLLAMTATPIPRSLALTLYGDLDLTVLDERPPRGRVRTELLPASRRRLAYGRLREVVERGERAFVVCPRIEGPGEGRAAVDTAEELAAGLLEGLRIGVLHGRMPAEAKQAAVDALRDGRIEVLVGTTVVEVGLDVPEASVLLVEDAERYGLAQLHQLRGRVGRSRRDGLCLLLREPGEPSERLRLLAATDDGFELAEQDLRLRGPGDFVGARQKGAPSFRLCTSPRFSELLARAREQARGLLARPDFETAPELAAFRAAVDARLPRSGAVEAG